MDLRFLFTLARPLLLPCSIALSLAGCAAGAPEPHPDRALRRSFPAHAAEVIEQGEAWVTTREGFMPASSAILNSSRDFAAALPRDAKDSMRLRLADGFEVRVRELAAEGQGELSERAIAYRRPDGASFW